jgi:hypothetical protein
MSQQDYAAALERIKASQGFAPSAPSGPAKPTMRDVSTGYANLLNTYKAQQDSEDAILNAFQRAHKTNPDEYARLKKRAIDAGLTIEQVEQFPAEAERRAIQDSTQRLVRNNPTLSKWLARDGNAELGKDDTDNMGEMEKALRWVSDRGRALAASVPAANAGLWGIARAGADVAGQPRLRGAAGLAVHGQNTRHRRARAGRLRARLAQLQPQVWRWAGCV